MQAIAASSNKIADIIGVIDSIAFQTNILALNAARGSGTAGEQAAASPWWRAKCARWRSAPPRPPRRSRSSSRTAWRRWIPAATGRRSGPQHGGHRRAGASGRTLISEIANASLPSRAAHQPGGGSREPSGPGDAAERGTVEQSAAAAASRRSQSEQLKHAGGHLQAAGQAAPAAQEWRSHSPAGATASPRAYRPALASA